MLFLGVDDTDSPEGGCTTALAAPLAARFAHLRPDGPARLVRLNPNIPWKTRGNAAICLRFHDDADLDQVLASVLAIVQPEIRRHGTTDPGIVVAREAPPADLYEAAVTRVVTREEIDPLLAKIDARVWGGRGVIGAAAAIAWPAERATYERISYRAPERVGTQRQIADAWVREVEWGYASIFDSYDTINDEVVCVPSGADPVLWGLRGTDPGALEVAGRILGPERPARETLFLTNQGTDDHLRDRRVGDLREYDSARVTGTLRDPVVEANGTVFLEVDDGSGTLRAAAYPPTRAFRHALRCLGPGDEVTVCGGLHVGPDGRLTMGLEKVCVVRTRPRAAGPPVCPQCHHSMKSAGEGAGYRCKECRTHADAPRVAEAAIRPGWHEVPASARRHLARPLELSSGMASDSHPFYAATARDLRCSR